jgi:hypothetical protein
VQAGRDGPPVGLWHWTVKGVGGRGTFPSSALKMQRHETERKAADKKGNLATKLARLHPKY